MTRRLLILPLLLLSLAACGSAQLPLEPMPASGASARAILDRSLAAHGGSAFAAIRDVSVRYDGRWLSITPRVQPVLVDASFRKTSEERLLLGERLVAQRHQGPGGVKEVVRTPGTTSVAYNGAAKDDAAVTDAAAVVADGYEMFLTGPFFFAARGAEFEQVAGEVVDGRPCDRIATVLRPGLGNSTEDFVVLSIDRETHLLRRVRFTLNGTATTRGAEAEVTFRDHQRIGGVLWPTSFFEQIRAPLNIPAHEWKLEGLELNRGLTPADVEKGWSARALSPAAPLSTPTISNSKETR